MGATNNVRKSDYKATEARIKEEENEKREPSNRDQICFNEVSESNTSRQYQERLVAAIHDNQRDRSQRMTKLTSIASKGDTKGSCDELCDYFFVDGEVPTSSYEPLSTYSDIWTLWFNL
ncbi:uncharacterized protein PRCAT00005723001 [Priceomyces carsonii]|uniref:uncharacterized protein n=1 Tax=Priceomyces carsonii TaxID=28549 RepID=UPI002EDB199A|nr:unnamed protein product [Priceomyces carsonii]